MEKIDDTSQGMDCLHPMAHPKSPKTTPPVCGMSDIKFHPMIPDGITLRSGAEEMIRCSREGFWVRGVKVDQDDKEAQAVYNAFKQWLTWAQLNDLR